MNFPKKIFSGYWGKCHCQGIAVDEIKGYIYFSFTTKLIKCDLSGNFIGSVDGLLGHLGCIDFNDKDGKVYGSLEYKNDVIGKGILKNLGAKQERFTEAFYCVIFDVDKITRADMDAEKDGVMRAVYLPEVVADYSSSSVSCGKVYPHKYGCSGIDGTAWGPIPGRGRDERFLNICYGIYGNADREDNDYQVILSFDARDWWETVAQPLSQVCMHTSGATSRYKFFLCTGSTNWGIQNLEYDEYTGDYLVSVYKGKKDKFPNFDMYFIDGKAEPKIGIHCFTGEEISCLSLKNRGTCENGIWGSRFPYGSTGIYAFGDGTYYFSQNGNDEKRGQYTNVVLYTLSDDTDEVFKEV